MTGALPFKPFLDMKRSLENQTQIILDRIADGVFTVDSQRKKKAPPRLGRGILKGGVTTPRFDGTGPAGAGSMTGGGFGFCNPAGTARRPYGGWAPGYWGPGYGRGFSRGRGFGRGFGPWCGWGRGSGWRRSYGLAYGPAYASPSATSPEDELSTLRDEANAIKDDLDAINKRIEELEKGSSE